MVRDVGRGSTLVNVPGMVLMFGGWWLEWYLVERYDPQLNLGAALNISVAVAALLTPFVLAWLWWSLVVPHWRIWAHGRHRDWPTLERLAIRERLIWDEQTVLGRIIARTEIWTPSMRRRFADLRGAGATESSG